MKNILLFAVISALFIVSTAFAADTVMSSDIKEADGTTLQHTNTGSGIKTNHIQDNAVTTLKIANGAVTTPKIAAGAVVSGKLSDGAVINSKIANGSVTGPKIADGAVTAAKMNASLYNKLLGNSLNVYDKNNLLIGAVLDSAQDTDAPVFGNQLYILMKSSGGIFYGVRASSKNFVTIADVHYSGTGCSGYAYSLENLTSYLIQPAHIGFYQGSPQLYSFIETAGTVGQTALYRSTSYFDTNTNKFVCTTHSAAYSATLYALTAANNLSSFVVPFHVAQ